jgi:hypothetical protein
MDKQVITGNGGASYTLTHAVANAQEIEVFVNNVRQEAGVAYTVAGTALSMTGNVASTDDFYVIYQGKALQTVVPPDGSVTSAKLVYPLTTFSSTGIDDNATSTAMTLDSSGNVGVGTTSPSVKIDAVGSDTIDSNANTAARFRASATSGADAGVLIGSLNGNTPFIGTDGGNASNVPLTFKTENIERMRIDSSGNLMVGSTSAVNVGSNTTDGVTLKPNNVQISRDGGTPLFMRRRSSNGEMVAFRRDTTFVGSISVTTSSTAYNTSSDHRLKENVNDITGATDRLKQLNPVRFNFIADADTTVDGFLAHEVQGVVPEAITGTKDAVDADGNPEYQGIDQSKLVPLLVATIQELEARIAALEAN